MLEAIWQLISEAIPYTDHARDFGIWAGAIAAGATTAGTLLVMGRAIITGPTNRRLDALMHEQRQHAERQEQFEDRTDQRLGKISGTQDGIVQRVSKIEGHLGL